MERITGMNREVANFSSGYMQNAMAALIPAVLTLTAEVWAESYTENGNDTRLNAKWKESLG